MLRLIRSLDGSAGEPVTWRIQQRVGDVISRLLKRTDNNDNDTNNNNKQIKTLNTNYGEREREREIEREREREGGGGWGSLSELGAE